MPVEISVTAKVISATILTWAYQGRRKIFYGIINLVKTESDSKQGNYYKT